MRFKLTAFGLLTTYFRIFHRQAGRRLPGLVTLYVLTSYVEGFGIALFFPLFTSQSTAQQAGPIQQLLGWLGLTATPRAVLPVIVVVFLFKGVLLFTSVTFQYYVSSEIARGLRGQIVRGLRRADYLHITNTTSGFYTNLLTHEVTRSSEAFIYFTRSLPPAVNIVVFFLIMFVLDWKLTLASAGMGLVLIACFRFPGRIVRHYSQVTTKENGALATLLVQTIQAFKYLRATASFGAFQKKIEASAKQLAQFEFRTGAAVGLLFAISQPLMVIFIVGILFMRLESDPSGVALLFVVLIYLFRIMTEIFSLQTNWQMFCSFTGGVDLVQKSIGELSETVERTGAQPFAGLEESLACADLGFGYTSDRPILKDISLTIPKNGSVAFVGESGAGKSTLVDVLIGVLRPTSGKVIVDGTDLQDLALDDFRAQIGYIPQDPVVFDDTIENNICLWSDAPRDRVREAAERAFALSFIDATPRGFETSVGERGIQLSGGQRQRIAIARELFREPEILVLDEATSALDSESERAIQESINELTGQVTIIIIAHRLSTIRGCDCIYVLDEGRIVEQGTYADLLDTPGSRFRVMCELQGLVPVSETSAPP